MCLLLTLVCAYDLQFTFAHMMCLCLPATSLYLSRDMHEML